MGIPLLMRYAHINIEFNTTQQIISSLQLSSKWWQSRSRGILDNQLGSIVGLDVYMAMVL